MDPMFVESVDGRLLSPPFSHVCACYTNRTCIKHLFIHRSLPEFVHTHTHIRPLLFDAWQSTVSCVLVQLFVKIALARSSIVRILARQIHGVCRL